MGSLTDRQKSIITGKLLGDGSLRKKKSTLLEINHSHKQEDYVFWLYKELENLVRTKPKIRKSGENRLSYRFTTLSHGSLNSFYEDFYGSSGRKQIPTTLKLDGLTLAVWFMDDGSKSYNTVYLNTQQFDKKNQEILKNFLFNKWNIKSTFNKDKKYLRLRIRVESIEKFKSLINPFIINSFRYKIPL